MNLPTVGSVCKFTLTAPFASLNGVYTVAALTTYAESVNAGIDYTAVLYTPAGLSSTQYTTDAASYQNDQVVVVQTVTSSPVTYYFPTSIIALVPDPSVKRYDDVYLRVHIGMFDDDSAYQYVLTTINDIVASITGEAANSIFVASPKNAQYLTSAAYAAMDAARQENIKAVAPLSVKIQEQLSLIDTLQAQVAALEATIIAMQQTT